MFQKILIANRGEIACRVIKTARRLGVATVAVYSEADAKARHARLADEAVWIGPAPARDSYLAADHIIAAARQTGAQAIHPGSGFLSENPEFAEACAAAGVVFIGPSPEAMRAMGSKSAAKTLLEQAGIPLTPGYHGERQEPDFLREQAERIGYPVLLKASAGGGGKGMRVVERAGDFDAALASCRREARSAFGDERVLLEKYLTQPRHIEIQIFGDTQGHYVYLFERDCSVQRRHQKVLEEAPAPGLTPERRAAMGEAALAAARAVGYVGAGTVEFIVSPDGVFYFMEMNTRLQVEHPITEMITGLDLVEWQLRVAAGEPLPLTQKQIEMHGHALEARIYAEDPAKGFLPSTGTLVHLAPPEENLHVRVDTGVEQGDEISPFYDPMIAKLIVWDANRDLALARMLQALAQYRIVGVANNVDFLSRLVASTAFARAELDTGLIERERDFLFATDAPIPREVFLVAALATLLREEARAGAEAARHTDPLSPWHRRDGWRLNSRAERRLLFRAGELEKAVRVRYAESGYALEFDGQETWVRGELGADASLRADLGGLRLNAAVVVAGERRYVFLQGRSWPLARIDPLYHGGEGAGPEGGLLAPMPGNVIALLVEAGATVKKGAPLLILEAMKMEHTLTAPADGTVKSFHFAVGDQVSDGAELIEFDPASA
ncbi:MAG: acetyl/propionyl/methylcrotonyl-CoA carboxylase subunit alpha [Candidatus Competibacteraceae bacterium]|nr:acetyl/propionyl/methylcrotonyl-CoA carboxylase subunit alpha [Candidatus Competibacteraceae bacterium]MBK8896473.1 acetyl/propionyl/methylcrotonyl-CoA carboxylase subunit alpha [Candidatus Competibacteraceae bacterium]MBK8964074.1 acetyl/propionyl/methylcrotonyl-CoA carboxylase subunit alpha [Candidatus Competibacteraceae bacterium]MBK9953468.1 acetyl/propionyl/methylcrotonyl-CoA carboxylase subunit alpha [Candidatus Competibacteraceae bacterium]